MRENYLDGSCVLVMAAQVFSRPLVVLPHVPTTGGGRAPTPPQRVRQQVPTTGTHKGYRERVPPEGANNGGHHQMGQ